MSILQHSVDKSCKYTLRCPSCSSEKIYFSTRWRCYNCGKRFEADRVVRDGIREPLVTRALRLRQDASQAR